jgi:ABC-type multidrug transport system ATPase subunit/ABC-type multidrug transport system permease subunit
MLLHGARGGAALDAMDAMGGPGDVKGVAALDPQDGDVWDVEVARAESLPLPSGRAAYLECAGLSYSLRESNTSILRDISVVLPPGRLVALMGPSGAGKTTLLNVLAGRGAGKVGGSLSLNGETVARGMMRRECKLVPQYDNLIPVLTARETLRYVAELTMDVSRQAREAAVEEVIEQLSLSSCADVACGGGDVKGLSGGQAKRVSMACELLADPATLLLDEPTSGLDSKVAEDVVRVMKALARGGRTVVCTIHQPSFQVFEMFDWLIMLDQGRVAYNGEVSRLCKHLAELGAKCPAYVNPADHFMALLSKPVPGGRAAGFPEAFEGSAAGARALADMAQLRCDAALAAAAAAPARASGRSADHAASSVSSDYATSAWRQTSTIFRRAVLVTVRDKAQLRSRVISVTVITVLISAMYWQLAMDQKSVQTHLSVFFLLLLMNGMGTIMSTALAMPAEKSVLLREYRNGYYSLAAWYVGRVTVLQLFQALYAAIISSCCYYAIGFWAPVDKFAVFLAAMVLVSAVCGFLGLCAGLLFPTTQAVAAVTPLLVTPLSMFAGLFIPYNAIPVWLSWIYWLSFFHYALEIFMVNQYNGNHVEACSPESLLVPGACPYGVCNALNDTDPLPCSGGVVLASLQYEPNSTALNFGVLVAFLAGFFALGMLLLVRFVKRNR